MKKRLLCMFILLIVSLSCVSCARVENKTVKIAVMGNKQDFYPDYEEGILQAVEDMNNEYADTGYTVECEFYDPEGGTREALSTIKNLARDESVTAVIASRDIEAFKSAAYTLNQAQKIYISPYRLYDSVFEDNKYNTVFSISYSTETVGEILRRAAPITGAKRWIILSDGNEYITAAIKGFLKNIPNDGIEIIDINNIPAVEEFFDHKLETWDLLGVQGVVILSDKRRFDFVKRIREARPDMKIMGNETLDDSEFIAGDPELMKFMNGVVFNVGVIFETNPSDIQLEEYEEYRKRFSEKHGRKNDTWYVQAYNMIRMIGDTAVKNNTTDSVKIAQLLHQNGYSGIRQNFSFSDNGTLANTDYQFAVMKEDDTASLYFTNENNEYIEIFK